MSFSPRLSSPSSSPLFSLLTWPSPCMMSVTRFFSDVSTDCARSCPHSEAISSFSSRSLSLPPSIATTPALPPSPSPSPAFPVAPTPLPSVHFSRDSISGESIDKERVFPTFSNSLHIRKFSGRQRSIAKSVLQRESEEERGEGEEGIVERREKREGWGGGRKK